MHGVIFTSFRDYLVASQGNGTAAAVFEAEPEYLHGEVAEVIALPTGAHSGAQEAQTASLSGTG
jgi:hypothetical protein